MKFRSENIGGIVSFAGSLLPIAAGDVQSLAAAAFFGASEVAFARAGHTSRGYSLGAAGFAIGDFTLAAAPAIQDNSQLKVALIAMGAAWTIGALRHPLRILAAKTASSRPHFSCAAARAADIIQPVVGVSCLALRIPGLVAAATGGNHLMFGAIGLWAASDVLCGRLQHYTAPAIARLRSQASSRAPNP